MEDRKYRVRKIIFDEILTEEETQKVLDEYNSFYKRTTAKSEGVDVISIDINQAPYRLEIGEVLDEDDLYYDKRDEAMSNTLLGKWNEFKDSWRNIWNS